MKAFNKPFLSLTARDLMTTDVVSIPEEMSLRAAAGLLSRLRVTGAPVVDGQGRCVGVLSATDFLRWAEGPGRPQRHREPAQGACVCAWQIADVAEIPTDRVSQYMTVDVAAVAPNTPIHEVARRMIDGAVHRLLVLDAERRPIGLVSGTDILGAVAYAGGRPALREKDPQPV